MDARVLIRARHGLWYDRVVEYNRRANAGEPGNGMESFDELASQAVAVVLELEHLADALRVELDARLYG